MEESKEHAYKTGLMEKLEMGFGAETYMEVGESEDMLDEELEQGLTILPCGICW